MSNETQVLNHAALDKTTLEGLLTGIAHRRSLGIARLRPEPVDRRLIEIALEAANWAPSNGDTEPWRFIVYTGDSRVALGEAFAEAYRLEAEAQGDFKQKTYEAQKERGPDPPVWIAIGMTPGLAPDGTLLMPEDEELMLAACAANTIHTVACAEGLAGMWLSNNVFRHSHTAKFVGLDAPSRLLGFLCLGWPAVPWPAGERKPMAEKVRWME